MIILITMIRARGPPGRPFQTFGQERVYLVSKSALQLPTGPEPRRTPALIMLLAALGRLFGAAFALPRPMP
jgi:hypothetical protein